MIARSSDRDGVNIRSANIQTDSLYLKRFLDLISTRCEIIEESRRQNYILGVVKRNPLFFHSISCKNNGFLFTTPNRYTERSL